MQIKFEIKNHADRMNMFEILQRNGYEVKIVTDTAYMPRKVFVVVEVEDQSHD